MRCGLRQGQKTAEVALDRKGDESVILVSDYALRFMDQEVHSVDILIQPFNELTQRVDKEVQRMDKEVQRLDKNIHAVDFLI